MYFYIFDQLSLQSKYQRALDKISLNITDFGIEGEKVKATLTKEVALLARDALKKDKNRNIIVVGSDKSASQVIDVIAKSKTDVAFGFIPLKKSKIASTLGLPLQEKACKSISRRKIKLVDLGNVNKRYFLTSLNFSSTRKDIGDSPFLVLSSFLKQEKQRRVQFRFQYNEHFFLETKSSSFVVGNLFDPSEASFYRKESGLKRNSSATDELLDIFILGRRKNREINNDITAFQTKWIEITSKESKTLVFDGEEEIRDRRFIIGIVPKKINIIVGSIENE